MTRQYDDEQALSVGPPMPRILDYPRPEEFSEALRTAGFLSASTEGVLADAEGVLRSAVYTMTGELEFVERTHSLSPLYGANRQLRADARQMLAEQDFAREAHYQRMGDRTNARALSTVSSPDADCSNYET